MEFSRTALAQRNMWFVKRKNKRVEDEESLIPGWLLTHPRYETSAALRSLTKGKSYWWYLEMVADLTSEDFSHWITKEM